MVIIIFQCYIHATVAAGQGTLWIWFQQSLFKRERLVDRGRWC